MSTPDAHTTSDTEPASQPEARNIPVNNRRERPTLLAPGELAAQLQVNISDLKRLRDQGRGPAYITLTPRTIRYLSSEVTDWLADQGPAD